MTPNEILQFLVPHDDPLQQVFFGVVALLLVLPIVAVLHQAKAENWLANWDGVEANGTAVQAGLHLDVEHGSLHDLSRAVATPAERVADLMPGILLVVGLLGTFIGLGLALDSAGLALAAPKNHEAKVAADSMADIQSMLNGLGTKFKTSTWGILGYLFLRGFASWYGFEEKRQRWCVAKMRTDLMARSQQKAALAAERHAEIVKGVVQIDAWGPESAASAMKTAMLLGEFVESNGRTVESLHRSSEVMADSAANIGKSALDLSNSATSLESTITQFGEGVSGVLSNVKRELAETIQSFDHNTTRSMTDIAKNMKSATDGISLALAAMQDALSGIIDTMDHSFSNHMNDIKMSQRDAAQSIEVALEKLTATLTTTQEQVGRAMHHQTLSHAAFVESQTTLTVGLNTTNVQIGNISERIVEGLGRVAESNLRVGSLNSRYETVTSLMESNANALERLIVALAPLEAQREVASEKPSRRAVRTRRRADGAVT